MKKNYDDPTKLRQHWIMEPREITEEEAINWAISILQKYETRLDDHTLEFIQMAAQMERAKTEFQVMLETFAQKVEARFQELERQMQEPDPLMVEFASIVRAAGRIIVQTVQQRVPEEEEDAHPHE